METRFSLYQLLQATGGYLRGSDSTLTSQATLFFDKATYDSREVGPGSLFVAMRGEESDGHLYIADALARGAAGLLVRQDWALATSSPSQLNINVPMVMVPDTLDALQNLARWWRNQFPNLEAIGITGSVGKSSTKELIAAVLSQKFCTFKSPKNINDQQSLMPILLELRPDHQRAVIEMGAGWGLGELTRLCRVVQPRIGVELGVSHSHIGRMLTLENIAQAKAELVQALPAEGFAVLNGDEPRTVAMAKLTQAQPFLFGLQPSFDLWADQIESFGLEGLAFVAHYRGQAHRLRVPFVGRHFVTNLLAACAVGLLNGLNWDEIEAGLQTREAQVRLLVTNGPRGSTIIDDAYNASPVSMVAALDFLGDIALAARKTVANPEVRKIAVLGDMLELGDYAPTAHEIVGRRAAHITDWLIVVGEMGREIGEAALAQGFAPVRLISCRDKAQAVEWLQTELKTGDYVLFKASRGMRFDEIIKAVMAEIPIQTRLSGKANS